MSFGWRGEGEAYDICAQFLPRAARRDALLSARGAAGPVFD